MAPFALVLPLLDAMLRVWGANRRGSDLKGSSRRSSMPHNAMHARFLARDCFTRAFCQA
jgi:hypothetical protein